MRKDKVYLICGERAAGKTAVLIEVAKLLQKKELSLKGFYSKGYWQHDLRTHYDLISLDNSRKLLLATTEKIPAYIDAGKYYFNPEAIRMGEKMLNEIEDDTDLFVVDEVGMLEYKGLIWYPVIREILANTELSVIWCVRDSFLKKIIDRFALDNYQVFDIATFSAQQIAASIYTDIKTTR